VSSGAWNSLLCSPVHGNEICCIGICDVVDNSEPNTFTNKDKCEIQKKEKKKKQKVYEKLIFKVVSGCVKI